MPPVIWLAAALVGSFSADNSAVRQAPSYSAASIVNAASNQTDSYAPNTFITIYGKNLAWTKRSLSAEDIASGDLPTALPGTGVRVWIGNAPAHVYYVSPEQINVLIPTDLIPGTAPLRVQLDSSYGPNIPITIAKAAPALFQMDRDTAILSRGDGSVATLDAPARGGEFVALYATGLGETVPNPGYGEIPSKAAPLRKLAEFEILLDGVPLDRQMVLYAGVAPGFAGLYQINLQLPDTVGVNPEIRLTASGVSSPAGIRIPVRP